VDDGAYGFDFIDGFSMVRVLSGNAEPGHLCCHMNNCPTLFHIMEYQIAVSEVQSRGGASVAKCRLWQQNVFWQGGSEPNASHVPCL
jgi:hypothetical protein